MRDANSCQLASGVTCKSSNFVIINYHLDWNNIGDDGCKYLAAAQWNNLKTLSLGKQPYI